MKKRLSVKHQDLPYENASLPAHYIFIVADGDRNRIAIPSAYELAKYRLKKSAWGMAERTRYRRLIKPNDQALIYISGHREFAQHIVAAAQVSSPCLPVRLSERGVWDAPTQIDVHSPYKVDLKKIQFFSKPLCIRPLISKLSFIKPVHHKLWRIYFQGGVARIPKSDFDMLLQEAKRPFSSTTGTAV